MNRTRALHLLLGRALADGEAVGPLLREHARAGAAAAAEAGNLDQALQGVRVPRDLARLTRDWPPALQPAFRRLAGFPSALAFVAPLAQTLVYFGFVGGVLELVGIVLSVKVLPSELYIVQEAGHAAPPDPLGALPLVTLLLLVVLLCVGVWVLLGGPGVALPWQKSLVNARKAALAAALIESGAPAALLAPLGAADGDAAELDDLCAREIVRSVVTFGRFVVAFRVVGYAVLVGAAFGMVSTVYGLIPQLDMAVH